MKFWEKLRNKYFNKKNKVSNLNSQERYSINSCATVSFSAECEAKRNEINNKLKPLIKKYINNPEKLLQLMQLKGLKIYKIKNANKILSQIQEEEGFISPLEGMKALFINSVISILYHKKLNINFSTNEMFIFNSSGTEIYTIARALYKYYGFKYKLPGYDLKSQEIFKKTYSNIHRKCRTALINCKTLKDIQACKEALARDVESINFALEISREYEGAQNALNIIKEKKSAKI